MREHILFKVSLWLLPVLCLGLAGRATAQGQEGIICAECHEGMASSFLHSFHAKIWQRKGMTWQNVCETCHGPADRHLQDPSRETIVSFGPESVQSAEEQSRVCLNCHGDNTHLEMWDHGMHTRHEVACASCHNAHVARSDVGQPYVCFECHKHTKMQTYKFSHHPIIEGKVLCSDCHNPHGTLSHGMIREENLNQLCYRCHAEKRGPFIWEHPPVEEDCSVCHSPHGSRHESLLTEKLPNLCQDCHSFQRHPSEPYDATRSFVGSSPSNRFYARACLNCHGNIHGSIHFENTRFTR